MIVQVSIRTLGPLLIAETKFIVIVQVSPPHLWITLTFSTSSDNTSDDILSGCLHYQANRKLHKMSQNRKQGQEGVREVF